ncbi:MAG: DUF1330 domain-containing protein [Dehalococcoidia bacterium]|nr:DUF1330 domain-containing protein [Dehalococcoidia bacterium]
MSTYLISTMTIHDPETYRKYTAGTPPTVKRHGGRFLTRGEEVVTLEGEPFKERMVIMEFPSRAHIEAWMKDPEYVALAQFRYAASKGRVIIQEGGTNTEDPKPNV